MYDNAVFRPQSVLPERSVNPTRYPEIEAPMTIARVAPVDLLLGALLLNLAAVAAPPAAVTGFEPNQGQFSAPILYALPPSAYIASNGVGSMGIFIQFDCAQRSAAITPSGPLPYLVNIYSGADPAKWLTGFPASRRSRLRSSTAGSIWCIPRPHSLPSGS